MERAPALTAWARGLAAATGRTGRRGIGVGAGRSVGGQAAWRVGGGRGPGDGGRGAKIGGEGSFAGPRDVVHYLQLAVR